MINPLTDCTIGSSISLDWPIDGNELPLHGFILGEQLFLDCFLERWKKIHEGYDQKLNDWDEKKGVVKCLVVKIMEERMWKEIRATNKR